MPDERNEAQRLGQRLREAREARELTLDATERATRIRAKFLDALERGDYANMTPVQAQGFLRNYARFLGLDLELLLTEMDSGKEGSLRFWRRGQSSALPIQPDTAPQPTLPRPVVRPVPASESSTRRQRSRRPRARRGWFGNMMIVIVSGGIVVALLLGGTQLIDYLVESSQNGGAATGVETLPASPVEDAGSLDETPYIPLDEEQVTPPVETPRPDEPFSPPVLTGTSVNVVIEVIQSTWIRITADGAVRYEGAARPGDILNYSGQQSVSVRVSNAAALNLTVNNQPQGILGERGHLFDYTFTLAGAPTPITGDTAAPAAALPTASPEQATLPFTPPATLPLLSGVETLGPSDTPLPTDTLVPTDTPADTPVPTEAPTDTPVPTEETVPLEVPSDTVVPTDTPVPTNVATDTPVPTSTSVPTDVPTDTSAPTSTPVPTNVATDTPVPTSTPVPTDVPTDTPAPTSTPVPTDVATDTPVPTDTPTNTSVPTDTPAPTSTPVPTDVSTSTPTHTYTPLPTNTPRPTQTPTRTPTHTATRTPTTTPTPTWTFTPSQTPTPSWTPTATLTPTPTPFLPPRYTRTPSPVPKR